MLDSGGTPNQTWDLLIAGGGPAGSMAAIRLAQADLKILLVDRAAFPRHKVCGCCLNELAIARLEAAGLGSLVSDLGAHELREVRLMSGGNKVTLPLGRGYAVSRKAFDFALAKAAESKGVVFSPETHAQLLEAGPGGCRVLLRQRNGKRTAHAKVVLCADGLGGSFLLPRLELAANIERTARIGLSAILEGPIPGVEAGIIYMTVGRAGYAGLVMLEDGTVDIAAAVDSSALAGSSSPGSVIGRLLLEAGLEGVPDLRDIRWKGTPPLTRRRPVLGSERIFILGDAAGYVEPFTGEGMAWALSSGQLVAPFARMALGNWTPDLVRSWERVYRKQLGRRQMVCRLVSRGLRHPLLYRNGIRLLNWKPSLAVHLVRGINSDLREISTI